MMVSLADHFLEIDQMLLPLILFLFKLIQKCFVDFIGAIAHLIDLNPILQEKGKLLFLERLLLL